jgi:hypothetical protein
MSYFAAELVTYIGKLPEAVAKELAPGINRHKQVLLCPKIGATGFEPATPCTPCKCASQTAPRPVAAILTSSLWFNKFFPLLVTVVQTVKNPEKCLTKSAGYAKMLALTNFSVV